jgi:CheY-like chemotaxis protein
MSQQIRLSQQQLRMAVLLLALVPALVIMILVLSTTTNIRLQDDLKSLDISAQQTVDQLAASADYALMSSQQDLMIAGIDRVASRPEVAAVRVLDAQGRLWLHRGKLSAESLKTEGDLRQYRAVVVMPQAATDPNDWLAGVPVQNDLKRLGEVQLWVSADVIKQRERSVLLQAMLLAICVLLVTLALAWIVSERVLARYALLDYDAQRQRVISHDLMRQANKHWRTEQALQLRWGKWSHDVRTPLHGVSGLLELLDTTTLDEEQRAYVRSARDAARALEFSLRNNPLAGTSEQLDGLSQAALLEAQQFWRKRRILLIEDDPVSAHLMASLLHSWGVELTSVTTGYAGLQALNSSWDLILLDGELPDYDAVSWWQAMQALPSSACALQGPVVVITAHDDDKYLAKYQAAGLDPVLIKPVRGRQLLSVLTPLLRVH